MNIIDIVAERIKYCKEMYCYRRTLGEDKKELAGLESEIANLQSAYVFIMDNKFLRTQHVGENTILQRIIKDVLSDKTLLYDRRDVVKLLKKYIQ